MSWRDRAIPADQPAGGSWRDRAIAAEPAEEQDILENAARDVSDLASGLGGLAKKGAKMLFVEPYQTGRALAEGKPLAETPLGESARGAVEIAKSIPGALFERGKEIVTDPVGAFKEHPVNTTLDVLGVAFPAAKAARLSKAGAVGAGTETVARQGALRKLAGWAERTADEQAAKAAGFTPAAFAAEEAPRTRQIGRMLRENKVVRTLNSSEDMYDRIKKLETQTGGKIREPFERFDAAGIGASSGKQIAERIRTELFDRHFRDLPADIQKKLRMGVSTGTDFDKIAEKIRTAAADAEVFGDAPLSFEKQWKLKRMLQEIGNFDSEARALRIPKQASGIARADLEQNVRSAADLMGDSQLADDWLAANKRYGLIEDASEAISRQVGKETAGSAFPVSDVATAGAGAMVAGQPGAAALYAAKKGYTAFGNQIAMTAAESLSNLLKASPQSFGQYAPTLLKAAERGDQSLAVTNFLLQQKDPAYRRLLEGLEDGLRSSGPTH
jgi:hypothetical protein